MHPIVTADIGDLLFLAIAIVAIIAQIRKAVRQAEEKTPGGTESPESDEFATETDAQEQLRRFLNSLNGPSLPQPKPPPLPAAPPPIPKPRRMAQPSSLTATYRQEPKPRPRPPVAAGRQPEVTTPARATVASVAGVAKTATVANVARVAQTAKNDSYQVIRYRQNRSASRLFKSPQRKDQLKQAVLLREILGPPLAFRQPAAPFDPAY